MYYKFVNQCQDGQETRALQEHRALFQEDRNLALAKLAIKENVKRKIHKLEHIYVTVKVTILQDLKEIRKFSRVFRDFII